MFECEVRKDTATRVTVRIRGALALGSATDRFRACLAAVTDRYQTILVDAAELKQIDSAGLGELVRAQSDAKAHGGVVRPVGANEPIRNLMVLTKLVTVFADEIAPEVV